MEIQDQAYHTSIVQRCKPILTVFSPIMHVRFREYVFSKVQYDAKER